MWVSLWKLSEVFTFLFLSRVRKYIADIATHTLFQWPTGDERINKLSEDKGGATDGALKIQSQSVPNFLVMHLIDVSPNKTTGLVSSLLQEVELEGAPLPLV